MTANAKTFCCMTPRAICYWAVIFLLLYGSGLLIAEALPALQPYREVLLFSALGIACLANLVKNRTFHCAITGPIFIAAATLVALSVSGVWNVRLDWLWPAALVGVGAALLLEFRVAGSRPEEAQTIRREGDER